MKDIVLKYYEEYKDFMQVKPNVLPNINPITKPIDTSNILAEVNTTKLLLPTVDISIYPRLRQCDPIYKKAVLFHEFTHILDANTVGKEMNQPDLTSLLCTYSEYHASQVQYAVLVGFEFMLCSQMLNLRNTSILIDTGEKVNIVDEFESVFIGATKIIDQKQNKYIYLNDKRYIETYRKFELKTMYYLGKRDFCAKHSIFDVAENTNMYYGEFAPFVKQIHKDIVLKKFQDLPKDRNELWHKYKEYFKCGNKVVLPYNI